MYSFFKSVYERAMLYLSLRDKGGNKTNMAFVLLKATFLFGVHEESKGSQFNIMQFNYSLNKYLDV